MDIFAHGLWTGAAYRAINLKRERPLKVWWAIFWGILPDLFAFTPMFVWMIWGLLFGEQGFSGFQHPDEAEPIAGDTYPMLQLAHSLYNISHSLAIFLLVAGLIGFSFKKIPWEMGGWLIHILLDIPSHSYKFFPTPFLWPFSEWKFDGWSWGQPWFMAVNYSLLAIVYFWFWYKKRKKV